MKGPEGAFFIIAFGSSQNRGKCKERVKMIKRFQIGKSKNLASILCKNFCIFFTKGISIKRLMRLTLAFKLIILDFTHPYSDQAGKLECRPVIDILYQQAANMVINMIPVSLPSLPRAVSIIMDRRRKTHFCMLCLRRSWK